MNRTTCLGIAGLALAGCMVGDPNPVEVGPSSIEAPVIPADVFAPLNEPGAAHLELCDNDGTHPLFPDDADVITRQFCQDLVPGGAIPQVHGLADLQALLGLSFVDPSGGNGVGGNPGFAILGHSSALTARKVTTITPTAFVFTPPAADGKKQPGYVFMAFDPGEQFVEVASHDPVADEVNLYVVLFDQACTTAPGGCTPTDLLTPALTRDWTNVRVYESETALNNTLADCRQCHATHDDQPQILRMQENTPPFTHWFSPDTEGGRALLADFHAAHGTAEDYGPIPAALVDKSDPALMATMIAQAGFATQPNAFDSAAIEAEVKASASAQPVNNVPRGDSPTWRAAYDAAMAGQFIAAPYHDVKITDPRKLATMSAAYRDWMSGARTSLPDIRDVFLDSGLVDMGFAPSPGADGKRLLVEMCQQCHNANLDPTITRDKFLVDRLDQMSREEKDLAIERLAPALTTRLRMPPTLFKSVTPEERQKMIDTLRQ
ncbi:MAG: hypothetical protein K8W52_21000 [Deltaproteobacteria bacterium]|nr:hypothetical protein [Deltaproteobacteria bacterium]